ncbi:MAG: hypothetical protein R3D51_17380 [Hyphomicrobiaceae bacterium]
MKRHACSAEAPPGSKTKEHVIPQWLIAFTGDPKRTWNLGVRYAEKDEAKRERRFAANQFHFPACDVCNNAYSELEGRAKGYITRLATADPLTATQWNDLLDWFDKVRVGLWLGMRLFSQVLLLPPAKFHIDQRIGRKDRFLLVYRINPDHKGLIMHGAGDLPFLMWPSWIALTINDLIFVNVSTEYLLASRMGFPFPRKLEDLEGVTRAGDFDAFFRVKTPLVRFAFYQAPLAIYQTILVTPETIEEDEEDRYETLRQNAYVRELLMPGSNTRSVVHSSDGLSATAHKPDDLIRERELAKGEYKDGIHYIRRFFEYRGHMLKNYIASGRGEYSKTLVRSLIKFNNWAIDSLDDSWEREVL